MAYLTMFTKVSFVSAEIAAESRNTLQSPIVTDKLATSMIIFLVRHKNYNINGCSVIPVLYMVRMIRWC